MKFVKVAAAVVTTAIVCSSAPVLEEDARIEAILSEMTLEEKIGMLHADTMFSSGGVPRLGIPSLKMSDGPHGVRWESIPNGWASVGWDNDACSYLPALSALAATWNRSLAAEYGKVLGEELKARGKNVSLAPGVNITRSVLNGRTWEYMSEDPYLTSSMAVPYIKGVQSCGVASCVKHFALNSQAFHQYTISSEVDERALHEIYLPAFEAAVKEAGVMAVMPAYNKVRGRWCSENPYLLDTVLRREFGFDGVIISDWNGVHSTVDAALTGLDIEMGTSVKKNSLYDFDNYYFANPLLEKVKDGTVPVSVVDGKVRDILRLMLRLDIVGKAPYDTTGMASRLATREHADVARRVAEESIVLLKNESRVLPLKTEGLHRVAVIGANADTRFAPGGGSTKLKAKYEVTPLDAIRSRLPSDVELVYEPGFKILNRQYVAAQQWFTDEFDRDFPSMASSALKAASNSDLVIYIGGLTHEHGMDCEGFDRPDMKLPYRQDKLLDSVLKANPNTVVVLMAGSPVEMGSWFDAARSVLQCSFLGMEGGKALSDVLFGDVNPSGKLNNTWSRSLEDMPDHAIGEYPGHDGAVRFNEGLSVGYRYFDTYGVKPRFEFGYGLSYTDFQYSGLKMKPVWRKGREEFELSFTVRNVGGMAGAEVSQVYLSDEECSVFRPEKELKGFEKVFLEPGGSCRVKVVLPRRSLQWYDAGSRSWVDEPGTFRVRIGSSSRDIRLEGTFILR